ncbi:Os12g0125600 [Oryza sativa Japonica Group]|uniref:Os12g0125600 protein n=1 Tax=Oryza sativa subsp. japonica TaxID=39947 RepID=A0A0P0Y6W0_ORYSJ|nr:Os12g0125600 [Oryza sativa Japonica Group]
MALDLNELADEGDEQAVPDLNEPVADEGDEHDVPDLNEPVATEVEMHVGQEEDQLGGDVQGGANHNHPDGADAMDEILQIYGGHNQHGFPFDVNSDAYEEHLQMQADMQEYGVYAGDVEIVFEQEELDDSDEEDEHPNKNLTNIQRQEIYDALVKKTINGRLRKKATTEVAEMFNIKRGRVQDIWRRAKQCRAQGIPVNVSSRKKTNSGRKKNEIDLSDVANAPLQLRGTLRSFASAAGIPKSTLHRMLKEGLIRRHSNTLKPLLKEENKRSRLQWCISMLDWHTLPNEPKRISRNMDELIHNVEQEFQAYDDNKLNRVFLTLQSCLLEVMEADGGNGYRIPHMGKERLERLDILPNTLSCGRELYEKVISALANQVQ